MTLATSSMWVSSPVSGVTRCSRSPSPVSVGVKTRWPAARSRSATAPHCQPPPQVPCSRTKSTRWLAWGAARDRGRRAAALRRKTLSFIVCAPALCHPTSPILPRSRLMLDPFVYKSDQLRVLFGRGAIERIGEEAARHKISRAMMLCSQNRGDFAQAIAARLGERVVGISTAARPGMPSAAFDEIVADIGRFRADGFVCVGGGSPTRLAKGGAAATMVPLIAVVTTYSGSEMSGRWYIGTGADERTGESPSALPASAIYDPDLTVDLPFPTSAASCMNAMAHAVESLYGPDANPIVLTLAEEAVRRLAGGGVPRHHRPVACGGATRPAEFRDRACAHARGRAALCGGVQSAGRARRHGAHRARARRRRPGTGALRHQRRLRARDRIEGPRPARRGYRALRRGRGEAEIPQSAAARGGGHRQCDQAGLRGSAAAVLTERLRPRGSSRPAVRNNSAGRRPTAAR